MEYYYTYVNIDNRDNGYLNELHGYVTTVNYSDVFDNLPEEVKIDLYNETEKYKTVFSNLGTTNISTSIFLDIVRNICEFDVDIELYIKKYNNFSKMGFNVYIKNTVYPANLQSFYYINFDVDKLDNYIYNTLFHIYIFIRHFKYSPLFNFFHHENDIQNMIEIRMRGLRLFGNLDDIDCSVCMEKTVGVTICKHILCQKCFSKLSTKICPMCRHDLEEIGYSEDEINIIIN